MEAKLDGLEIVLNEQYSQREQGKFDDEYLSKAYRLASRLASIEAKERALKDEKDAMMYHRARQTAKVINWRMNKVWHREQLYRKGIGL